MITGITFCLIEIAMRDLELRGAGNLLGAEQHGHMQAVGYDLYCKLLNEAVLALRGENEAEDFETVWTATSTRIFRRPTSAMNIRNSTFTSGFPVLRTRKSIWICRMS